MVDWVTENIEATDELADPASFALARGRGQPDRAGAGARRELLGIPARPVLARSRLVADAAAPQPPQELDDFADALVELDVGAAGKPVFVYADLRLRHAAFGYLPPGSRRRAHAARPGRRLRRWRARRPPRISRPST